MGGFPFDVPVIHTLSLHFPSRVNDTMPAIHGHKGDGFFAQRCLKRCRVDREITRVCGHVWVVFKKNKKISTSQCA